MTIRQLRDLLATMHPDGEALVTLFHADGSAETFAIEDVTATHGEAHIEISDEEPAAISTAALRERRHRWRGCC
jgi:hypothetical protein